jgi:hypothetical protein
MEKIIDYVFETAPASVKSFTIGAERDELKEEACN